MGKSFSPSKVQFEGENIAGALLYILHYVRLPDEVPDGCHGVQRFSV